LTRTSLVEAMHSLWKLHDYTIISMVKLHVDRPFVVQTSLYLLRNQCNGYMLVLMFLVFWTLYDSEVTKLLNSAELSKLKYINQVIPVTNWDYIL
jgi:hypothetical protein